MNALCEFDIILHLELTYDVALRKVYYSFFKIISL